MSGGIARGRLTEERKAWRKNYPHGFVAKSQTLPNGSVNLMLWQCRIPGQKVGGDLLLLKQILVGIQDLLDHPNLGSPVQYHVSELFAEDRVEYKKRVRQQAKMYSSVL
ncbi:hypothetical protein LUZ60_007601 [Juncus effusus]|nr:hypothetical protein LUZ60_007601 [Juncus effusus]